MLMRTRGYLDLRHDKEGCSRHQPSIGESKSTLALPTLGPLAGCVTVRAELIGQATNSMQASRAGSDLGAK